MGVLSEGNKRYWECNRAHGTAPDCTKRIIIALMIITKHAQPNRDKTRLIWTDLEMSGLDPAADKVLEAAFIITDGNLNIVAEAPPWVIAQPDSVLDGMDDWNRRTHGESGLIEKCRQSQLSESAAAQEILIFLQQHTAHGESPMCGNSICQDRRFMARHLPTVEIFFHYRNFDVSSFKIAMHLYMPQVLAEAEKPPSAHQALCDIKDSINEMRFYLNRFFPDAKL